MTYFGGFFMNDLYIKRPVNWSLVSRTCLAIGSPAKDLLLAELLFTYTF